MGSGNFFSRKKETYENRTTVTNPPAYLTTGKNTYDSLELKNFITKWTGTGDWKLEDFTTFLELVGLKTPVQLSNFNKEEHSFTAVTADHQTAIIGLVFGDFWEWPSGILVTIGEETKNFNINSNSHQKIVSPRVELQSRIYNRGRKKLDCYYCEYFCSRTLELDETHSLEIRISEPDYDKFETLGLRNCTEIEKYLFDLSLPFSLSKVYETVMGLLNFSAEDIANSPLISFTYKKKVSENNSVVLGAISLEHGEMQQYSVSENDEIFHVFKNGDWKYTSNNTSISYDEEQKQYSISITGEKQSLCHMDIDKLLQRIEEKISELWKFVK